MVELLGYLEANGFSNYIASGGGRDFMRPISQEVYGIPRERVIGSATALEYTSDDRGGTITHKAEADYLDDGPQKPIRIWSRTGRRPLLAAGNSNGDIPMLDFTQHPDKPSLRLLVLHDDAEREFDYTSGAEQALERAGSRAAGRSSASRTTGPPSSDDGRAAVMEWALAVIALSLIGFGMVSRRVDGTSLTPAIVFVGVGLLVGAHALDLLDVSPTGESVKLLAEATLTLVLFVDASRIDLRTLRSEYAVPARLLGVGLPLTIALGAAVGSALFGALSVPEAVLLAVVLAPTDAALGQAVVTEPRLPSRIRQGLNVESGLNDGICVPLLFIVLGDR